MSSQPENTENREELSRRFPQQKAIPNFPETRGPKTYNDKNVVVIGGSKGVGRSVAEVYANAGARVIATSHRNPGQYPPPANYTLWPVPVDARDDASVRKFFESLKGQLGSEPDKCPRIHLLVIVAANFLNGALIQSEEKDLAVTQQYVSNLHLRVIRNAQAFMTDDDLVISFSSAAGVSPAPLQGTYSSTKSEIIALATTWNIEREILKRNMSSRDPRKSTYINTPRWVAVLPGWMQLNNGQNVIDRGCGVQIDLLSTGDGGNFTHCQIDDPIMGEIFGGMWPIVFTATPTEFVANCVYNISTLTNPHSKYLTLNVDGYDFGNGVSNPNGFQGDIDLNNLINAWYAGTPNEYVAENLRYWSRTLGRQVTPWKEDCRNVPQF